MTCGAFSSPTYPRASEPYLWHLCRDPISERWRFRTHRSSSGQPRLLPPCVRDDHTISTTQSAFHQQVIAPSGSAPSFIDPATLPPRSDSRRRFARLAPLPKFPQGWLVLCDLGSRPRKSTLLLVRDAVRLRFSEPRRRPPIFAIDDDARTRRAYGSSSPVNAALDRFALP